MTLDLQNTDAAGATFPDIGQIVYRRLDRNGMAGLFKENVDTAVRTVGESQRLPGVARIYLPSEQSHTKRLDRLVHGVPIPPALRKNLDALAQELGIEALL